MKESEIIADELEQLIANSRETALEDGKITKEEGKILDILIQQTDRIKDELLQIVDSEKNIQGLEEEEIRKRVRLVSREIYPLLEKEAKKDDKITKDESAILSNVLDQIM